MRIAERGHKKGEMERNGGIKTSEGKNSTRTDVLSQRKKERKKRIILPLNGQPALYHPQSSPVPQPHTHTHTHTQ